MDVAFAKTRGPFVAALLLWGAWLAGCQGELLGRISTTQPPSAGDDGTGGGGEQAPTPEDLIVAPPGVQLRFQCAEPAARGLGDSRLRRLTRPQLVHTLGDLLGPDVTAHAALAPHLALMSSDAVVAEVTELSESHSTAHVAAMLGVATAAADLAFSQPAVRERVFGACAAQATISEDCARAFIQTFAPRAFRRPLAAEEGPALMAHYLATKNAEGLKRVLMRILLAPELAFHLEPGREVEGNRVRLTDHEVASRIAYRVTGTMPDAALRAAADRGELQQLDQVKAQVRRLYAESAGGKAAIAAFFRFYLLLDRVPEPPVLAHRGVDVTGLREEMLTELSDYVSQVVWAKQGTFSDLLLSRETFPRSERMAKILETVKASGAEPVTAGAAHQGLLLRPALLASSGTRTNPMHRGALYTKRVLCTQLGAPDPAVVDARATEVGDLSGLSNRDRYTRLTDSNQCSGCHARINPLGFALEGYDQLGMARADEVVVDAAGGKVATHPIDTRVSDPNLRRADGSTAYANAAELVETLARSDDARACFAEAVFEFQRLRTKEAADGCALREVENAATQVGSVLDAFVLGIANQDIFWRAL